MPPKTRREIEEEEKTNRDREIEREPESGNEFIRKREKAISRGASKREASRAAAQGLSSTGQISVEEFNKQREQKLIESGLIETVNVNSKQAPPVEEPQERGILSQIVDPLQESREGGKVQSNVVPFVLGTGGGSAFKVGKDTIPTLTGAVKSGTALKNSETAAPLLETLFKFSVGAFAALKTGEGIAAYLNRIPVLEEQQQAVNTLGQVTSTIVGDSTSGRGDARKGLQEIRNIRREVLRLEKLMQEGSIRNKQITLNGKIFDLNADIQDQLATLDEGQRDIETFILSGLEPELSDFELQALSRELEAQGILESVDLTSSRRVTE